MMTQTIQELLASLRQRHEEAQQQAHNFERQAAEIMAQIRGVRLAQDLLTPQAANGAEPPKQRRPRRDIKELVREYLARDPIPEEVGDRATFIATQIGCRPAQVKKALAALPRFWAEP